MQFVHQPAASNRLGEYLQANFSRSWTHFRAAVAFVKRSGTRHIAPPLSAFTRTGQIEIISGIDHRGTSAEGLRDLLDAVAPDGRVVVFHNRLPHTFHPKIYLFKSLDAAEVLIGSGNLTEGGLFTNYEASLRLTLDLANPDQAALLRSIEQTLDGWAALSSGTAFLLDDHILARLTALGLAPPETRDIVDTGSDAGKDIGSVDFISPFATRTEPRAPSPPRHIASRRHPLPANLSLDPQPVGSETAGFFMTLQRTDVGVGQTTAGTSRRSPEIFIPLSARNAAPDFWEWPGGFMPDSRRPGKFDRHGVRMRLGGEIVTVNMMTWPDKHDFRLRSEAICSAGNIGDILRMEKVVPGSGFEYYIEIIPK